MRFSLRLAETVCSLGLLLLLPAIESAASEEIPLAGTWGIRLDTSDQGLSEQWWRADLPERIQLPGALQSQGYGDDVSVDTKWTGGIVGRTWFTSPEYAKYRQPGNVKIPFWLQPEKHYVGPAWYQREIELPPAWEGKRITLNLERPHWETRVWFDDRFLGSNDSLSTPHEYDLGTQATPGKHRLTIRVDNRLVVDVGINSHSVSDHTQSNWNGIVGRIELRSRSPIWIDRQRVYPSNDGAVRVEIDVRNTLFNPVAGVITTFLREKSSGAVVGKGTVEFAYPRGVMPDGRHILVEHERKQITFRLDRRPEPWSEFAPRLYDVESVLRVKDQKRDFSDTAAVTCGFREIGTQGTQFVLNGRKIFLRGTLECCIFPKTGYPPTDVESWRRIVRVAKAHGLNLFRFHSWCPPEAAFVAADELGFYYQIECASWANFSTKLGLGLPIDPWLYKEGDRILRAFGNHPSFILMTYGNEPAGDSPAYLGKWVLHYKQQDSRRLYTSASGWPQIPENQFHITPDPRIQGWGAGLKSRINAKPPETQTDYRDYIRARSVPVVSHEIGQWCVYPNFDEIAKYTGYLKPKNFEIFRESLAAHHMADRARDFLLASGKLQTICYKEEIESALRTPGMGGFELLDLHDFPGQGTALVGVLDPFWESKGYVTAAEYRRFAGSTVPLARLPKRVWMIGETLAAEVEIAHFGPAPLHDVRPRWKLVATDGKSVAEGSLPPRDVPIDNGITLGSVHYPLEGIPVPARYKLVVTLEGTPFENDWDLWIYPKQMETRTPPGVQIVDALTPKVLDAMIHGDKVLLMAPPNRVRADKSGKIALGFSSIFWNTAWTGRQPPHTLGILCDPKHPALADFPTECHSNWQWWYLLSQAQPMILDDLPIQLRPVVQVIDDWVTNRKLALIVEAKAGAGKLLICSIDLRRNMEKNPVARQMLHSLFGYMTSERFNPSLALTAQQIRGLVAEPATKKASEPPR